MALGRTVNHLLKGQSLEQLECRLTVSKMQIVCFEAANSFNERPIGCHPTDPDDGVYLCPNQLLLGRASARVPSGPFRYFSNLSDQFSLVEKLVDSFWRQWTRDYFPSLLVRQKWHTLIKEM